MSKYSGRVIEAQPDWLTVSAHGEESARAMLDLALGLAKEEEARGAKPRKWRSMGYEGISMGRVQYGQRDVRATELRLSGDSASVYFEPAFALADTVTRLDLAVTWRGDEPYPDLGHEFYGLAVAHHHEKPGSALPWTVNDADGGFTAYIGKRESEYFCRIYNKEAQERKQMGKKYDGKYDRCWRFELETKASVPMAVGKKWLGQDDRPAFTQAYLHEYLTKHGLTPPFDPAGGAQLVAGFRRASDEDTKLLHLQKNVAPTVRWLADRGRDDELRTALGLRPQGVTIGQLGHILARYRAILDSVGRGSPPEVNGGPLSS